MQSQGRNDRLVEMVDFFPTAIDLMGLPPIAKCVPMESATRYSIHKKLMLATHAACMTPGPGFMMRKSMFTRYTWTIFLIKTPT